MRRSERRRGATLYVAVMGVGMIVGVIALTTSLTGRIELQDSYHSESALRAAMNARSGLEYALNYLNRDADWRTNLTSGVDNPLIAVGGNGAFYFRVTDEDGDLADDPRDHAVLRVVGQYDGASTRHAIEVDIEPAGRSLTCLESAVHSATDINLSAGATLVSDGIASSNNDAIGADGTSRYEADVEVVRRTDGGTYPKSQTEGVPAREMPGDHVFDWYVEHGTEILYTDLSNVFGARLLTLDNFSRWFNQHGEANPHGIYWIDCGGGSPRLSYSRLVGTLVLLNAGPGTRIDDVLLFQSEAQNYPVLMVQGDLRVDLRNFSTQQELHEGLGQNYNPPGVPYEGVEDSDDEDQYPARLDGIVYVTGTLRISDASNVQGHVVANYVTIDDNDELNVDYTPYSYHYPPPGFSAGSGARMLPGSYRRVGL